MDIPVGPGDDALTGGDGDDLIEGFGGQDRLDGAGGEDVLRERRRPDCALLFGRQRDRWRRARVAWQAMPQRPN